jgi:TatD DNase family protein
MMIDTHVHLWDKKYSRDSVADVVARARAVGVEKMLCLGCDRQSSEDSVKIAGQFPGVVFAAVGTHPSDAMEFDDDTVLFYRDLIGDHLEIIMAVGEIGLDYHYPNIDKKQQVHAFKEQIGLARSVSLPIVVHCRDKEGVQDAYIDALAILDDSGIEQVVYHCFSGTLGYSSQLLERGYFMSFTGVVTYPNAKEMREVVKACPLEKLMIETDSPYLTPQSNRGKRNEPMYVEEVLKCVAEVKGISVEEVEERTSYNAEQFFGM